MRIYKTRADFTKLQAAQNPSVFAGTICTITDEAANPMYTFQNGVWNSLGGSVVASPTDFTFPFATIPLSISQIGKTFTASISAKDFIDPACLTGVGYHVDQVNGNDANTGVGNFDGDFRAAISVKTIGKAITLGNATGAAYRLILKGGTTYALADMLFGGVIVPPTRSIAVFGYGSSKAVISSHSNPTWALDSGTTYTGTAPNTSPTNPVGRCFDITNKDAFGDWTPLTLAASAAACRSTPGTYFTDTTLTPNSVYVNRTDAAVVTEANTRVIVRQQVFGATSAFGANNRLYVENMEFWGGNGQGALAFAPNNATSILAGYNIASRYSDKTAGNGISVDGGMLAIMENWECSANHYDGFSIHDNNNRGTVAISINGHGYNNGYSGATSCNGFTTHDGARSIDINGRHHDNYGGNSAHVSTAVVGTGRTQVWSLGCDLGTSRGNYPGSATLRNAVWNGSGDMWFDTCTISSQTPAILSDALGGSGGIANTYIKNCTISGGHTEGGGSTYQTYS